MSVPVTRWERLRARLGLDKQTMPPAFTKDELVQLAFESREQLLGRVDHLTRQIAVLRSMAIVKDHSHLSAGRHPVAEPLAGRHEHRDGVTHPQRG